MTDCPNGEMRDLLPDLLHDRLAPDRRREVEAHVRGCEDCRQELALLRSMRTALRRAPAMNAAAIAAAIPPYRIPVRRSRGGWRAAAAIVILAAGGASVTMLQRAKHGVADSALVAPSPDAQLIDLAVKPESASTAPAVGAPRELALGSASVSDLDDAELSTLLKDLQTIDVLPSADVEPGATAPLTGTE